MHLLAGIAGFAIIAVVLGDAFETIVLPRRVTRRFRFTRLFYRSTWLPWRNLCLHVRNRKRREVLLSLFGPLSLILLLSVWALSLIFGFALLQWAFRTRLSGATPAAFLEYLYLSGTTFPTLGLGDLAPVSRLARFLTVWEAATGFGFFAIVIGYLPVIYQAFSERERNITLLDARAGSPPSAAELLRRYAEARALPALDDLLAEWEHWSAGLLESHISYPVVALFRSQHNNQSWLGALTTILDTSAILLVGVNGVRSRQAQLTFAMARHALVDLAQVLNAAPVAPATDRLPPAELERLRTLLAGYGASVSVEPGAEPKLRELRSMYEPYACALARFLAVELPGWFPLRPVPDNWQTSAWERAARRIPPAGALTPDDHL
ncbi:MAG: potassium channel family protein [Terriglobales bacterium]